MKLLIESMQPQQQLQGCTSSKMQQFELNANVDMLTFRTAEFDGNVFPRKSAGKSETDKSPKLHQLF